MADVIGNLYIDVHPSQAKLTVFLDGNCCLSASTVNEYSHRQRLLRVLADGSTSSLRNALYHRRRSMFEIALPGMLAETNPNMR